MHYLFDSHVHSHHSHDGKSSVEALAKEARQKGLAGFCLTDHYDGNLWHERDFNEQQAASMADLYTAKEKYYDTLDLRLGIELGEIFYDLPATEAFIEEHPCDMILLAVHKLKGETDFYCTDYSAVSQQVIDKSIYRYFEVLLQGVQWGGADVVAHLTLLQRYLLRCDVSFDFRRYLDPIDQLLRAAVEQGMGIEINTSGLRGKENIFMPELWGVERFYKLGGEIVTIGSDAHTAQDIGSHLTQGMELLAQAGFRYFAVFENRKPQFYSLD